MALDGITQIGIEVDKIIESIEEVASGVSHETAVLKFLSSDLVGIKSKGWAFNWSQELARAEREVFKLVLDQKKETIQGLISLQDKGDHIFMHLIESAPTNLGKDKKYRGVAGNLIAFACKRAFERKYDGFVSFHSKTNLIKHYQESLEAKCYGGTKMVLETLESMKLVRRYFKDFEL